jgi:hypothetical protein
MQPSALLAWVARAESVAPGGTLRDALVVSSSTGTTCRYRGNRTHKSMQLTENWGLNRVTLNCPINLHPGKTF